MPEERYNVEMIRDFLAHLLVEVRVAHSESTPHATHLNIEQVTERKAFSDKYGASLLPRNRFEGSGVGEEVYEAACESLRARLEVQYTRWIRSLEDLSGLLDDALSCAARGGVTDRVIDVTEDAGHLVGKSS